MKDLTRGRGLVSNNKGIEKSICTCEEQHPVSFLVAMMSDHSVAETAPQNVQCWLNSPACCPVKLPYRENKTAVQGVNGRHTHMCCTTL